METIFIEAVPVSPLAAIVLFIVLGCTGSFLWWRRVDHDGKRGMKGEVQFPSPPKVLPTWLGAFGGHMLLLDATKFVQQYEKWANDFGGTYELFVFGTRQIAVVDPFEARRILSLRPSTFRRGQSVKGFLWATDIVGVSPSLFTDEGADWGRSRRLVAPPLSGHNVRKMVPAITKIVEGLLAKWDAASSGGNQVIDAKDDLGRFTHDVISLVGFRYESKTVDARIDEPLPTLAAIGNVFRHTFLLLMNPFLWAAWKLRLPIPWVKKLTKEKNDVEVIIKDLTANEKKFLALEKGDGDAVSSSGSPRSKQEPVACGTMPDSSMTTPVSNTMMTSEGLLLRKLVEATDAPVVGGNKNGVKRMAMSEDEIVANARGLFLAGQETTSHTLAWALYFLAKRPEVMARCRTEALEKISSRDGIVKDYEEVNSLVYINAVFKETLRLKTTVPYLGFSCKEKYTMCNGTTFPAGTCFGILFRFMATMEKHFTRAKEFIPERWIEEEREEALLGSKTASVNAEGRSEHGRKYNHVEEAFLPFGNGPRACPGMGMANLEIRILLAALSVQFDVALAPGQADPPKDHHTLTCGPNEMNILLTKRALRD